MSFVEKFGGNATQECKKALLLRSASIVILSVLPLVFIMELIEHDVPNAIAEGIAIVMFGYGTLVLFSGDYKKASICDCIGTFLLMFIMSMIVNVDSKLLVFRNSCLYLLCLSFCALFLNNLKIEIIFCIINGLANAFVAFIILPRHGVNIKEIVTTFVGAEAIYFLSSFFLIKIIQLNNEYKEKIEKEASEKSSQFNILKDVVRSTTATLDSLTELKTNLDNVTSLINTSVSSMNQIGGKIDLIDDGANHAKIAVSQISSEISELSNHIENQISAQEESAAATNQMVSAIQSVANTARDEKQMIDTLEKTSKDGEKKLFGLIDNISKIQDSMGIISQMVGVINSISAQTNLLAMNAAIEAAHAGNAGKGFAVVAEEIRKLADNTNTNASQIDSQVKNIASIIDVVVCESQETKYSFGQIQSGINRFNDAFTQISNATEELSNGGRQVLSAISVLSDMSNKISSGRNKIVDAQEQVVKMTEDVSNAVTVLLEESKLILDSNQKMMQAIAPIEKISDAGKTQAAEIKDALDRIIIS